MKSIHCSLKEERSLNLIWQCEVESAVDCRWRSKKVCERHGITGTVHHQGPDQFAGRWNTEESWSCPSRVISSLSSGRAPVRRPWDRSDPLPVSQSKQQDFYRSALTRRGRWNTRGENTTRYRFTPRRKQPRSISNAVNTIAVPT